MYIKLSNGRHHNKLKYQESQYSLRKYK